MTAKRRLTPGNFLLSYGFVITLVAMVVLISAAAPSFLTIKNGIFILHAAAPTMILATGVALVLMTGKIDISIGSTAYLSAGVGVMLMTHAHMSPLPACLSFSSSELFWVQSTDSSWLSFESILSLQP